MGKEIERKFLVRGDEWRAGVVRRLAMRQGYLGGSSRASVRVRAAGDEAWLNVKSGGLTAARQEFEYRIPAADAGEMLETLCEAPLVEKTRHWVPVGGFEWEVDVFHGANDGLIVAEIELADANQTFPRPTWLGAEVTHLARFYNVNLVKHPYTAWDEHERKV
jgi:adenylate cyclase